MGNKEEGDLAKGRLVRREVNVCSSRIAESGNRPSPMKRPTKIALDQSRGRPLSPR